MFREIILIAPRPLSTAASAVRAVALGVAACLAAPTAAQEGEALAALLARHGVEPLQGVAEGFVADTECSACHFEAVEGYAETGMAQSFYRPAPDRVIEDFANASYYHRPSDRHFEMALRDGAYWFRRYRKAADGTVVDDWSVQVDWIMGSGNHSRVYLYQTGDGALFELPLAWYSQEGKWAMAPGFEFADHQGVRRQVRHRCMTCHNAIPELPAGADVDGMPELFPAELPQGLGCQRCHGPGARHVALALSGTAKFADLMGSVINPARLPADQASSVCYGCHMQPSVAVASQLRLGRGAYDSRPGQDLRDFLALLDITDGNRAQSERFDINHHAYRLEQSPCVIESGGALGCLSCHNPHDKVPPEKRAAHYRAVCLDCHETDAAGLPQMARAGAAHPAITAQDDCTACHMPERRPQDVTEVWMTDHRITRDPGPGDLRAPIAKELPDVTGVHLADPAQDLPEAESLVYRAMAVLDFAGYEHPEALGLLREVLPAGTYADPAPWLRLANGLFVAGDHAGAARAARRALDYSPGNPEAMGVVALAAFRAGNRPGGVAMLERLLADHPEVAELHYNLGTMYLEQDDLAGADRQADRVIDLRANSWRGWELRGDVAAARGNPTAAADAWRQGLAVSPERDKLRAKLADTLAALGRAAEAERHRNLLAD